MQTMNYPLAKNGRHSIEAYFDVGSNVLTLPKWSLRYEFDALGIDVAPELGTAHLYPNLIEFLLCRNGASAKDQEGCY